MIKRLISIVLTAALVLPMAICMPAEAFAASMSRDDLHTYAEARWYAGWATDDETGDIYDYTYYSDDLFTVDSHEYNYQLATATYDLAAASKKSRREDDSVDGSLRKSRNLEAYLEDNGFTDFEVNDDFKKPFTQGSSAVGCAHKTIIDGGREYTLLVIAPRGGTTNTEFLDNMTFSSSSSDKEDHAGFRPLTQKAAAFVREYVAKYGIKGDVKVWLSGYSRSAGIANQLGAALIDSPGSVLGSGVSLAPQDLYCYTYGSPGAGSLANGSEDSKYDYIHNLADPWDMSTVLPTRTMGFARYGQDHEYASWTGYASAAEKEAVKARMLQLMDIVNKGAADKYYGSGADPDRFHPKKLDTKALLSGQLKFADDEESYIPDDFSAYMGSIGETLAGLGAEASRDGKNARSGFYDEYEGPFSRFAALAFGGGLDLSGVLSSDSSAAIPMIISMYTTALMEKSVKNRSARVNDMIEASFNALAYYLEDENGVLKPQYSRMSRLYNLVRAGMFTEAGDGEQIVVDGEGSTIPHRYVLVKGISLNRSLMLMTLKKLTASFYSQVAKGLFEDSDLDKALVDQVLSDEDCRAMSYIMMHLLFSNTFQSSKVEPFRLDNEQFKQLATFADAAGRIFTLHNSEVIAAFMRARDSNYDDYAPITWAQLAGYRRVYIDRPAGMDVSGTVTDGSGSTVATFVNDELTSRTDEWIGITRCDTGSWLRLPADKEYKVEIKNSVTGSFGVKVGEYSPEEGKLMRVVDSDDGGDWGSITLRAGSTVTLGLPAIKISGGSGELPSDAAYTLAKAESPDTSDAPLRIAARGVSSSSSTVRVTWTGVSGADRYLIELVEYGANGNTLYRYTDSDTRAYLFKGLEAGTVYRFKVTAQQRYGELYDNKAVSRASYVICGAASGSYTNPKAVKLNKTNIKLKKGKTFRLKPTVTKVYSSRKLLGYTAKVRYFTTDKKVATVSSSGIIKAKARGKCKVYAQAVNGIWKAVTVSVK